MLEIYSFDLFPYRNLTAFPGWPFPNGLFDPAVGPATYAEHIEEAVLCEELGFDGVILNEHHCSAYGLMPSPNLIAATLAARTARMKLGILGVALPLRGHPVRVAEEYAMLDCLSNGRLIAGLVRGVPNEYFAYNVRPAESRARFEEAHDILVRAWNSKKAVARDCDGETVPAGFEGVHVFDLSNLTDPDLVASVVLPCGSHTLTMAGISGTRNSRGVSPPASTLHGTGEGATGCVPVTTEEV